MTWRLTPRAAGALAVAALIAVVTPWPVGVAAVVVVGAAIALDRADALRRRRVPTRELPRVVVVGRSAPAIVGPDVAQPWPDALRFEDGRLTATRRGAHTVSPGQVRTLGALGLVEVDTVVGEPVVVRAYPAITGDRRVVRAARSGRFDLPGRTIQGPLGPTGEFETLRDYRPDDDIRQVNWPASARAGRTLSNAYRVEQSQDVVLALDCGRLMATPAEPGGSARFEAAVEAACAVALTADALGDRVGLVAYDQAVVRRRPCRASAGRGVIDALVDLGPCDRLSDSGSALAGLGRHRRSLVVLLSDVFDAPSASTLERAVAALATRHRVVVALVSGAGDEIVRAERSEVLQRLARNGAVVVDGSPTLLPAATVRAYVTAQAAHR